MNIEEQPLVSIIVVAYNSAKYVVETLESAKSQTYKNIELIVTDDSSTDNTVEICNKWIEENRERFVNTKLVTFDKNTGISPNANRGLANANGIWLKFIAGDDMLHENAIDSFMEFINFNHQAEFLVSDLTIINQRGEFIATYKHNEKYFSKENIKKQHKIALKEFFVEAPGIFILRKCLLEIGGFDENYLFIEDYPLIIKLSKQGTRFFHINKPLVLYRKSDTSICNQYTSNIFNELSIKHFNSRKLFFHNMLLPALWEEKFYLTYISRFIQIILEEKRVKHNKYYFILKYIRFLDLLFLYKYVVSFPLRLLKRIW